MDAWTFLSVCVQKEFPFLFLAPKFSGKMPMVSRKMELIILQFDFTKQKNQFSAKLKTWFSKSPTVSIVIRFIKAFFVRSSLGVIALSHYLVPGSPSLSLSLHVTARARVVCWLGIHSPTLTCNYICCVSCWCIYKCVYMIYYYRFLYSISGNFVVLCLLMLRRE